MMPSGPLKSRSPSIGLLFAILVDTILPLFFYKHSILSSLYYCLYTDKYVCTSTLYCACLSRRTQTGVRSRALQLTVPVSYVCFIPLFTSVYRFDSLSLSIRSNTCLSILPTKYIHTCTLLYSPRILF